MGGPVPAVRTTAWWQPHAWRERAGCRQGWVTRPIGAGLRLVEQLAHSSSMYDLLTGSGPGPTVETV